MDINLKKAVKKFFPNPSLEMVYFEAIANSIDAGATKIILDINIFSFDKHETLTVKVSDNGKGFNEINFRKFCRLLETDDNDINHKGVGRLVYLSYFKKIDIESVYENKQRSFIFNDSFEKNKAKLIAVENMPNGSVLSFSGYIKGAIKTYDYVKATAIKKAVSIHFFPQLHALKLNNKSFEIIINVTVTEPNTDNNFYSDKQTINNDSLPNLNLETFPGIDLFGDLDLYYPSNPQVKKNKTCIYLIFR